MVQDNGTAGQLFLAGIKTFNCPVVRCPATEISRKKSAR